MHRPALFLAMVLLGCGGRTDDASGPAPVPAIRAGAFVALGTEGAIVVGDAAGARWDVVASGTTRHLLAVAAGASRVVVVGSEGALLVSGDARRWTAIDSGVRCDLTDVAFVGSRFLAVGGDWSDGSCGVQSRDGLTWSPLGVAPTNAMAQAIAVVDGTIVVSAYGKSDLMWPALFRIVDDRWEPIDLGDEERSVVFHASTTTAAGTTYVVSPGISEVTSVVPWSLRTFASSDDLSARDVVASGDTLVAVGENGAAIRSGTEWTRVLTTPNAQWSAVTQGADRFVAVGRAGRIMISSDGRSWTDSAAVTTSDLQDVAYLAPR